MAERLREKLGEKPDEKLNEKLNEGLDKGFTKRLAKRLDERLDGKLGEKPAVRVAAELAARLAEHCLSEVEELASFFNVEPPRLEFRYAGTIWRCAKRRLTGKYVGSGRKIIVGVSDFTVFLALKWRLGRKLISETVAHEFMHHVQFIKHGYKCFGFKFKDIFAGVWHPIELQCSSFATLWAGTSPAILQVRTNGKVEANLPTTMEFHVAYELFIALPKREQRMLLHMAKVVAEALKKAEPLKIFRTGCTRVRPST